MKIRVIMLFVLVLTGMTATAKKKVSNSQLWPDGTPIPEWFSDTTRVDLSSLKQ